MSYPMYYVPAGSAFPVLFATYGKASGQSITMTGFAVTDIEIYKNGLVTQRASDNGVSLLDTDGTDFDGITGIHGFQIDLSDNSDAGFYTVGAYYHVVVSAVTVDGETVNFVACGFRIMEAESPSGVPDVNITHVAGVQVSPAAAGALPVDVTHFGGVPGTFDSGRPNVNASHVGGSAVSQDSGVLNVNVVQISGDQVAADSLEAAFDGTGNVVITAELGGTVLGIQNIDFPDGFAGMAISEDGAVSSNVKKVNDVLITGNGTTQPMGAA